MSISMDKRIFTGYVLEYYRNFWNRGKSNIVAILWIKKLSHKGVHLSRELGSEYKFIFDKF